jgi:hypothetical protein
LKKRLFLIPLALAFFGAGLSGQTSVPLVAGQQARRLYPEGWHAGKLEYTSDLLESDKKAGRASCLAINLESGGLPFSVIIRERDSIQVWAAPKPDSAMMSAPTSGRWVSVPRADLKGIACPPR